MGKKKKTKTVLSLDLGENGGPFAFYTIDEIREWVENENKHVGWLRELAAKNSYFNFVLQEFQQPLTDLANRAKVIPDSGGQSQLADFKKVAEEYYKQKRPIHSGSPLWLIRINLQHNNGKTNRVVIWDA